ncbi:MAG: heme-binding domain-containing protein [Acidimicrobiia bacterium]
MTWLKRGLIALVGLAVVIQFVPYGRDHENPPVIAEPAWDSPTTRELAVRACFDCHSNETQWGWFTEVAPMSWFIQNEVDEGRSELNYSEWNRPQEGDESAETVREGSMPPRLYSLTRARLTEAELDALAAGLAATLGEEHEGDSDDDDDDDDDD